MGPNPTLEKFSTFAICRVTQNEENPYEILRHAPPPPSALVKEKPKVSTKIDNKVNINKIVVARVKTIDSSQLYIEANRGEMGPHVGKSRW